MHSNKNKITDFLNKSRLNQLILFLFPLISIFLKCIFFQGFITGSNPYSFNFNTGYAIIVLDVCYFRGFLTVPSILIATQTANLDNLSGAVYSMFSPLDVIFIIDFFLFGIYVYFTRKYVSKINKRAIKTFLITFIMPILFIGYVPFN
ncbi:LTA synthase family protein, partial [Clostridium botulinum]|nr:LTA synthase family protein [Clostridium botulinum]